MIDTLAGQVGAVLMVSVCAFAMLKGDEPERLGAGAYLIAWLATLLIQNDSNLYSIPLGLFAIDVITLLVFIGLAWKSRRAWPIWASGLQLLTVSSHILGLIEVRASLASFYAVMNLASYGILLTLAAGTFWAWQERRAAGIE
ncbi:MAG: hypothetical protein EON91_03620 [Brevundimonas sp.]|uniref:hypothetical protein n=1 Tax=Brevundimonas sp. TaxID=1871086 RepID=UPI001215FEAE|nr:hypothetical protein [Brevundimonas sp.]RZJ18859.1 MAG: hypothetical protein EON91_03620 [Brevundimonas sp.]